MPSPLGSFSKRWGWGGGGDGATLNGNICSQGEQLLSFKSRPLCGLIHLSGKHFILLARKSFQLV